MRGYRHETCIGPFTGIDGHGPEPLRPKTRLTFPFFASPGLGHVHRGQPKRLPSVEHWHPSPPWHGMSSHLQTSPGGPAIQGDCPPSLTRCPGLILTWPASNDDMLLSAFDLTIHPLPTFWGERGTFACRSSRPSSAPAPIGHVLRPMGACIRAPGPVEPVLGDQHSTALSWQHAVDSNGHLTLPLTHVYYFPSLSARGRFLLRFAYRSPMATECPVLASCDQYGTTIYIRHLDRDGRMSPF
ncbi:hypothetical protein LY76DRAFT_173875 [Colletotrichum caudatum]|nr:hypothetical protein LY76DRAFT_173875 [Colletotrichum caudatum]